MVIFTAIFKDDKGNAPISSHRRLESCSCTLWLEEEEEIGYIIFMAWTKHINFN